MVTKKNLINIVDIGLNFVEWICWTIANERIKLHTHILHKQITYICIICIWLSLYCLVQIVLFRFHIWSYCVCVCHYYGCILLCFSPIELLNPVEHEYVVAYIIQMVKYSFDFHVLWIFNWWQWVSLQMWLYFSTFDVVVIVVVVVVVVYFCCLSFHFRIFIYLTHMDEQIQRKYRNKPTKKEINKNCN